MRGDRVRQAVPALVLVAVALGACGGEEDPGGALGEPTVAETDAASATPGQDGAAGADPTASTGPTVTASASDAPRIPVGLTEVASGFAQPVQALPAPDGGLLVVEQPGRVRLARAGEVTTFLDLGDRVTAGGERGLLSVALPPGGEDRRIIVHYSGQGGRTTLSSLTHDGTVADAGTERILLTLEQPASNHNGGGLEFGPDRMLYLALGDGGAADDRFGNGQRPDTLLGTLLRLDVSSDDGSYAVPDDNPFVDGGGAPEVWAYGLRNPWRFAFGDGVLYVADVGQNAVEEINAVPAGAAGLNYGWPVLEGPDCFRETDCDRSGLVEPVASYRHADTGGCAVIGGIVHRGPALAWLDGMYLYADTCSGLLRGVRLGPDGAVEEVDLTEETGEVRGVLGFGQDAAGETLLTMADGRILRLSPA